MGRNLLITAFRSLKKNKFFSFLNILGLSIGMSVFLIIALYVRFEKSYESFISENHNIYRVTLTSYLNNELSFASAENYPGVGPALQAELPEVVAFARLYNMGYKNNVIITNEDAKPDPIAVKQTKFLYADSSFLGMMDYKMVAGKANSALAEPLSAVISESYAKLYFGTDDPLGKTLRMQDDDYNNELVKVTGVFKDLPRNTHLKFDVLFSYKTLFSRFERARERYDQSWTRKDMYTFIKVQEGTNPKHLESKLGAIVEKYSPGLKEKNQRDVLTLQSIGDIHLTSNLAEEVEPNGDGKIVVFLSLIGLFVLVIAWVNYVNLSTAKAMERAKEVGVRKVMGAFKHQLIRQFLAESAMVNFLAIAVALIFIAILLPAFNSLAGQSLHLNDLCQPWFLTTVFVLWIIGTSLSGFYPAMVLSSFKPVSVLKGKLKNSSSGIILRKALVVAQFMASVALIAGTLIVYRQLDYMMSQDIGMNIDQVIVIERPGISPRDRNAFSAAIETFKNEVKTIPSVQAVTSSVTIPGKQREYKAGFKRYGSADDQLVTLRANSMDYNFLEVFKMKLIAGRAFSSDYPKDQDTSAIVTASAVKALGFKSAEEAVGQTITAPGWEFTAIIVGVVNDYHQASLKKAIDPMIFYCSPFYGEYYSLRITPENLQASVEGIRTSYQKAFPGNPFDYFFLDDYFNRQYENEKKFGKLFNVFAGLAVVVGCLGLFGLSAYTATQRTKEIGIRKALGSTDRGIFILLSQEYVKLISLAVILSVPLTWIVMDEWIESFPYRTTISPGVFIIAGVSVLIISILTVSYQTIRAARTNPINSLRYE